MEIVKLIKIKKLRWVCPNCRRYNEESYPISEKVVCDFCGEIYITKSHNIKSA